MNKEKILEIAGNVYVGYNPAYTLDTAIAKAGRKFSQHLNKDVSLSEMKNMMKDYNVIQAGGLDNFLVILYQKIASKE